MKCTGKRGSGRERWNPANQVKATPPGYWSNFLRWEMKKRLSRRPAVRAKNKRKRRQSILSRRRTQRG